MQLTTIEQVPMFTTTLRIMKFWSLLLEHNWRRYLCLIPYFVINISQFLDIFYSTESIDVIVRNAYIAVLFFNATLRGLLLCINRFEYEKFMDNIRFLYIELMESEDKTIRKMLQETTKFSRFISSMNLFMGFCTCIGYVTYPKVASSRVLPYGMKVPGIDKYESPFYQIFYVCQVIITPMGCCMYVPFNNLILTFVLFAILMCKVMQHKLENLKGVTNEKAREVIVWCIKYQLQLIRYVDTINHLTAHIFLVEFLAHGAMLCAMLFLMLIVETIVQKVILSTYVFTIFFHSFVMHCFANELYDQSILVANAAYASNWFEFDVATQKTLQVFILRSQKPCAILVGRVYPMNLEMFQSLLNMTYTYFTLLKRVYG